LRNVCSGKTCKSCVLGTARAVGPMARTAGEHGRLSSPRHDFRQRRVIARVPIGAKVQIADLRDGERRIAVRYLKGTAVIRRLRQTRRIDWIGPCRRAISEWRTSGSHRGRNDKTQK
jgi:hypothetical protein